MSIVIARRFPMPAFLVSLAVLSSFSGSSSIGIFRKYRVVHEAVYVIRSRPEFHIKAWLSKVNQTTPVLNCDFEIVDPKLGTFQVWIEGFERFGLEHIYTKSAISLSTNYCDYLKGAYLINGGLKDYGNFPTNCPLKPGKYTVRNHVVDEKYLPPAIPGNHWRMDIYIGPAAAKVHSNETAKFSYYFKIVYL